MMFLESHFEKIKRKGGFMTSLERMRYRNLFNNPNEWKQTPFQTVKRIAPHVVIGSDWELGVLWSAGSKRSTVYLTNLLEILETSKTVEEFMQLPRIEYEDMDELLDDGWIVD